MSFVTSSGAPFVASVTSDATRGKIFAFAGLSLCVIRGSDDVAGSRPAIPDGSVRAGDLALGALGGVACFARALGDGEAPPPDSEPVALRGLFGALADDDFAIAALALGVVGWDRDHRFCSRCGTQTARSTHERARICPACGFHAYPRISPAIITLVERDGRALLARNARTQMPFYSTLAGFVELGETLEECVAREVREEAGIELADIRYFGSQPWPFTGSLMIGFTARWASGELVENQTEIRDAGWFAPDALPPIPPRLSIAYELITDFARRHGGAK